MPEPRTVRTRPQPSGLSASSYLLAPLVAGVLAGLALGALLGSIALGVILGVLAGSVGGFLLVRSRFRDL